MIMHTSLRALSLLFTLMIMSSSSALAADTDSVTEEKPAAERVREGAHELGEGTRSVAHEVKETVKEGIHAVGEGVSEAKGEVKTVAKDALRGGKTVVKEVVHTVVGTTGDALHGTGQALKQVGEDIKTSREGTDTTQSAAADSAAQVE